ncbi:MAG TPA: hypothetical protein VFI12_08200 [Thermomicrobiales bacterium]|nr:hypothetical protein [Thermomicrobiales bacterium]
MGFGFCEGDQGDGEHEDTEEGVGQVDAVLVPQLDEGWALLEAGEVREQQETDQDDLKDRCQPEAVLHRIDALHVT